MRLSAKHTYTLKGLYPGIKKVSKATRKKMPQYMCEAQRASNGLYISIKVIRYMTNQNDGHPSCDHGLEYHTSSTNPCGSVLRSNELVSHAASL